MERGSQAIPAGDLPCDTDDIVGTWDVNLTPAQCAAGDGWLLFLAHALTHSLLIGMIGDGDGGRFFCFSYCTYKAKYFPESGYRPAKAGRYPFCHADTGTFLLAVFVATFYAMIVSFQSPSVLLDFAPRAGSVLFQSTPSPDGEQVAVSAGL